MIITNYLSIQRLLTFPVLIILCIPSFAQTATITTAITPEENVRLADEAFDRADIISAMQHYRKAAEAGHSDAMTRLAYLLDKSEKNEEAVQWLQKAVALENAEAQFELARMYAYGEGVTQDKTAAIKLFTLSAEQNYAPAIRVLAQAFENGDLGLRVDYELSRQWLQRGQQINDLWSIKRLASAYRRGDLGLRINQQQAQQLEMLLNQENQ